MHYKAGKDHLPRLIEPVLKKGEQYIENLFSEA